MTSEDLGPERLRVRPLTAARFVLLETALFGDTEEDHLFLGDEIETEVGSDGIHRLVRIAVTAAFSHNSWTVPRHFAESREFEKYCAAVTGAGGDWERVWGGILFVHVPHGSTFNAQAELDNAIAAAGPESPDS